MLVCPSCGSSRIRNDYKPAPIVLRVIGYRALLCDNCNYPFRAFSPLPPKTRRPRNANRKADVFNPAPAVNLTQMAPAAAVEKPKSKPEPQFPLPNSIRSTKPLPPSHPGQQLPERLNFAVSTVRPQSGVITERVSPVRTDLRTEITKLYTQEARLVAKQRSVETKTERSAAGAPLQACPDCGSRNVKRRHRNLFERAFLSFTEHKPYICRNCEASFYARPSEQDNDSSGVGSAEAA